MTASPPQGPAWDAIRAAVAAHQLEPLPLDGRAAAAVLIPIVPHAAGPHIVLTVRSQQVEYHRGEISFPGGAHEPHDADLLATALRESHEEVGIRPEHVEVLGELSHHTTRTGFHITPFVGLLDRAPYPFTLDPVEVGEILDVPLSHLLDPANAHDEWIERDGARFTMRSYRWRGHVIYGATAMILLRFIEEVATRLAGAG